MISKLKKRVNKKIKKEKPEKIKREESIFVGHAN